MLSTQQSLINRNVILNKPVRCTSG